MPCVTLTLSISSFEAGNLLGTLRRELRCLYYAAQHPERRDREDIERRCRSLEPLAGILSDLCEAAKVAERCPVELGAVVASHDLPGCRRVIAWHDATTREPRYLVLDPLPTGPVSSPTGRCPAEDPVAIASQAQFQEHHR